MRHYKKHKHNTQTEDALEELIDKQHKEIRNLQRKNNMLQEEKDFLHNMIGNKDFIINAVTKESNQNALTAKYLTHIFLLMNALDRILDENCTMGRIIKKSLHQFYTKLSDGMLLLHYDIKNDNLWYDPFGEDNDDEELNDDEEEI